MKPAPDETPTAAILCGPTATGKTALAVQIAALVPVEIISADSRQVYRHLDIGTAKPTATERAAVRHHLIDFLELDGAYNAARFAADARRLAAEIRARGCVPLVVGGAGFYLRVLETGLFDAPYAPEALARVRTELLAWPTHALRTELVNQGAIFQSGSDTEVVLHLAARSRGQDVVDMLQEAVRHVQGAGSFLFATRDTLIAYRDPHGFRPLAIGRLGEATLFASETCAFDLVDAEYVRDVEPGEMVIVDATGTRSVRAAAPAARYQCIFEHVYFARPDSRVFGENVDRARRRCGKQLAREHPAPADIVISVPDSSNTAAMGFAQVSGLRYEIGLIRNHYVGRTFINPAPGMRSFGVRVKFNPVAGVLRDRRVVLVDDSIVRGTTMTKLVKMVRAAGAVAVHLRIASPPVSWPCFYGIDTPSRSELLAARQSVEEMRQTLDVESLGYLSLAGLRACVEDPENYCTACFDGRYPVDPFGSGEPDALRRIALDASAEAVSRCGPQAVDAGTSSSHGMAPP